MASPVTVFGSEDSRGKTNEEAASTESVEIGRQHATATRKEASPRLLILPP